jgi:hypothetical protein
MRQMKVQSSTCKAATIEDVCNCHLNLADFRTHNTSRTKANPTLLFIVALIEQVHNGILHLEVFMAQIEDIVNLPRGTVPRVLLRTVTMHQLTQLKYCPNFCKFFSRVARCIMNQS